MYPAADFNLSSVLHQVAIGTLAIRKTYFVTRAEVLT